VASQKCARAAPARAGSDPRIEQLAGRLDRVNSNFRPPSQPDTWKRLGCAALRVVLQDPALAVALLIMIGGQPS
jgi:hypothetical protein